MTAHPLDHEFLTIMGCLHEAYDPADPAEHYHVEEAWSCLKRLASEIGWPWDGDAKLSSTLDPDDARNIDQKPSEGGQ